MSEMRVLGGMRIVNLPQGDVKLTHNSSHQSLSILNVCLFRTVIHLPMKRQQRRWDFGTRRRTDVTCAGRRVWQTLRAS
jgi:hypothetical protein